MEEKTSLLFHIVTNPCCGLAVVFCSFISLLIGYNTINIPEIFSRVHGFTGKTAATLATPNKVDCINYERLVINDITTGTAQHLMS